MKILCPTDFSPAAGNGIEYAARLCQNLNASLTLLNVQPLYVSEGVGLYSGEERPSIHGEKEAKNVLDTICQDVTRLYKISCNHEIIPSVRSIEKIIADEAGKFNLTVIGSNGADNIYKYYFGSYGFNVAKRTSGPVIIVPENYRYHAISKIVFASDYNKGDELLLIQLREFTEALKTRLDVVHISENDSDLSKEVYRSFCNIMEERLNFGDHLSFHRVINKNEIEAIDSFMHQSKAGMLALCMLKHGLLYRMTHQNLVKKISSFTDYPVLVLHK